MVCDWNEETVHELLMPGMFEDFYFIKYHEGYRDSFDAIPGDLFEDGRIITRIWHLRM